MIALVQRVLRAEVRVDSPHHRESIDAGLCVLLGVEESDDDRDAVWMAAKLAHLRIFRDDRDKMNRSVQDIGGSMLVVSQFTLAGDCSKGNRPSFVAAASPALGRSLYQRVCELLRVDHTLPVKTGVFGAMMQVELLNDGPVTLIVRSPAASDR